MKLYFGHPINTYNTPLEKSLLGTIQDHFGKVFETFNPNQEKCAKKYAEYSKIPGKRGMDYYFEEVLPNMDAGIFLPYSDGKFGKGVYSEAQTINKANKRIWQITHRGIITPLNLTEENCLSVEETRARVYANGKNMAGGMRDYQLE